MTLVKYATGEAGSMDIGALWQLLKDQYIKNAVLTLPADNTLGSADITALIGNEAFYDAQTLVFELVQMPDNPIVDGRIVLKGRFRQQFLGFLNPESEVTFYLAGQTPQLLHTIYCPQGWAFPKTFPKLQDTFWDNLAFSSIGFVLASADERQANGLDFKAGLNVAGKLLLSSKALENVAPVWLSGRELPFGGTVQLPESLTEDVPVLHCCAIALETGMMLGNVALSLGLKATAKPHDITPSQPEVELLLASELQVSAAMHPIAITATVPEQAGDTVKLMAGSEAQSLFNLNDMAALAGGTALGNLVPTQFPLGDNLSFQDFNVILLPQQRLLISVGFRVSLQGVSWALVPGNLITLESVYLDINIIFAQSGIQNTIILGGVLGIGEEARLALYAGLPGRNFSGYLLTQDGLDVMAMIRHFFGDAIPQLEQPLVIKELRFNVNTSEKTYSLYSKAMMGNDGWTLSLGDDLPFPRITLKDFSVSLLRQQTNYALALNAGVEFLEKNWRVGAALPGKDQGWIFSGEMLSGQELTLQNVVDGILPASWNVQIPGSSNLPKITGFRAVFNTKYNTFSLNGALQWQITLIEDTLVFGLDATLALQSSRKSKQDKPQYSGQITGDFSINRLHLTAQYAFAPDSTQISFIFEGITATYVTSKTDPFLRVSFGNKSLGEMLEFLLSIASPGKSAKLPAPWNILNAINLNGLLIEIHFKTKVAIVTYAINRDFGFIKIDTLGLEYKEVYGKGQVSLIITGNFLGQSYTGANALRWNPADENPPALPGAGDAAFDLIYLGLGQHVSLRDAKDVDTVDKAITALKNALKQVDDPNSNPIAQLPGIAFDSSSNWLIGMQFTAIKAIAMSVVFNDPKLYGLLISLAGPKAGSFAGLRFEILYRKVTDSIGVYHIELKLPDIMRRLQMGSVTITLPVVALDIYTNGDFRIDLGFPASLTDFSRSFSVEVFPFIGLGGFYFAKLNGQTSSKVPVIDNGRFQPVIEFGIALAVGLGKTINVGILSGGISITVNGMVQGVYAYFEPNDEQLPSARFFALDGAVAVVGKIYATVDFGIISASVSLEVFAMAEISFEVYKPTLIAISAGVRVSVSVKIIFIRIHFSFSATIRESFTIGSASTPPWRIAANDNGGNGSVKRLAQRGRASMRMWHKPVIHLANVRAKGMAGRRLQMHPVLLNSTGGTTTIKVMVTPAISKALSSDVTVSGFMLADATPLDEVVLSTMLFIETATPPDADSPEAARLCTTGGEDKPFNVLLSLLLKWAITSIGQTSGMVTEAELEHIFAELQSPEVKDHYFTYDNLVAFFAQNNIVFELAPRPDTGGEEAAKPVSGAFFPMIPELALSVGEYSCNFKEHQLVSDTYAEQLQQYFADLAVQYANAVEKDPHLQAVNDNPRPFRDNQPQSLATFVFCEYFMLLTRAIVQAAIDQLKAYRYTVADFDNASLQSIAAEFPEGAVEYTVRAGDTLASIAALFAVSEGVIEAANPTVDFNALQAGERLDIPVAVTPASIVAANQTTTGLLRVWSGNAPEANRPAFDGVVYQIMPGDVLDGEGQSITKRFEIPLDALVEQNLKTEWFQSGASVVVGDIPITTRVGDSLQWLAQYYAVAETDILAWNQNPQVVLAVGQELVIQSGGGVNYPVKAGDTLEHIAAEYEVTVEAILHLNHVVKLAADQHLTLKNVTQQIQDNFIATYSTTTGDTLDSILTRYFGVPSDALATLVKQWNPNVDFRAALPEGTLVEFPYPQQFQNISRYFDVPPSTFLRKENTANPQLLKTRALAEIPTFYPAIGEGDSFASLAQRFGFSLEQLTYNLAGVQGIFAKAVEITIPFVPAFEVDKLAKILADAGKMNEAASMMSRFLLQGLRVPAPTEELAAHFAQAERLAKESASIATYPLFSLIGQQCAAPDAQAKDTITVKNVTGASWISFGEGVRSKGTVAEDAQLSFALSAEEKAQIAQFKDTVFNPSVMLSARLPVSAYIPNRSNLQHSYHWQAAELPAGLMPNGQLAGEPTLWTLPQALQASIAALSGKAAPYKMVSGTPMSDGRMSGADLHHYGWAASVELGIRRIASAQSDSGFLPDSFLLTGADQNGMKRLIDLWHYLSDNAGEEAEIFLLYPPNPADVESSGYVADAMNRQATVVLKTNLSTLSHGTEVHGFTQEGRLAALRESDVYSATLEPQNSADFIRLVWECSVVKTGGFYLTYRQATGTSLPLRLFNTEGEATLTLLVVLKSQMAGASGMLHAFNNVVMVGDNLDSAHTNVFAQAITPQVGQGQTLEGIAQAYPQWGITAAGLAVVNQQLHGLLRPQAVMHIPNKADYTIQAGDSFASIAAAQQVDVASLGAANAAQDILEAGAMVQLMTGQLQAGASIPPGTSGFLLKRHNPEQEGKGADRAFGTEDPQHEVDTLFNLLGFHLEENDYFHASGQGLPIGPTQSDHEGSDGLTRRLFTTQDDAVWQYKQAMSVNRYAKDACNSAIDCPLLPERTANPYAGIAAGAEVSVALAFQDIFGNRTTPITSVDAVKAGYGYNDPLISLEKWPSTSAGFLFSKQGDTPYLEVDYVFSTGKYMPAPGSDYPQTLNSARVDRERMRNIYYQLVMPDVTFALTTTMGSLNYSPELLRWDMLQMVTSAYITLVQIADLPPVVYATGSGGGDSLAAIAEHYHISAGEVAQANGTAVAVAWWGKTSITIPLYYAFRMGDYFQSITGGDVSLLAVMAMANQYVPMQQGTVMRTKTRSFTVPAGSEATLQNYQDAHQVSLLDAEHLQITGFITANKAVLLRQGNCFTVKGVTITVAKDETDTLEKMTQAFVPHLPDVTLFEVALENRYLAGIFADNAVLILPNYLLQAEDTLYRVATQIGPVSNMGGDAVVALLTDNQFIPNLYPAGTALYWKEQAYALQAEDTLESIATQFNLSLEDVGSRNAMHGIAGGQNIRIPYLLSRTGISASTYVVSNAVTFADIVAAYDGWSIAALAASNAHVPALFNPAQEISLNGKSTIPQLSDTFTSLATFFGLDVEAFVQQVSTLPQVVRIGAVVYAPAMTVFSGDTLAYLATRYQADVTELAEANASIYGLLKAQQEVVFAEQTIITQEGDSFTRIVSVLNQQRMVMHLPATVTPAAVAAVNPGLVLTEGALMSPVRKVRQSAAVTPAYDAAITPVQATLVQQRDVVLVDVALKDTASVWYASTQIAAQPYAQQDDTADASLALNRFAWDFEAAFSGYKLATGEDRGEQGNKTRWAEGMRDNALHETRRMELQAGINPERNRALWAVNFGTKGEQNTRFNYQVNTAGKAFYALPPLSTELWNSGKITVYPYISGEGLGDGVQRVFQSQDVDSWASTFLCAMDEVLSPAYATRIYALDMAASTQHFHNLVEAKGLLAEALKKKVAPVLQNTSTDGQEEAREAMHQQLLIELGAAYSVDALVQVPFAVQSGAADAGTAARLSGKPVVRLYTTKGADEPETLQTLAKTYGVSAAYLALVAQNLQYIINAGITVAFAGVEYVTVNDSTLSSIAAYFNTTPEALADGLSVVTAGKGLFRPDTNINLSHITYAIEKGDTWDKMADALSTTVQHILLACKDVEDVFAPDTVIRLEGQEVAVNKGDTPAMLAAKFQPALTLDTFAKALWAADVMEVAKAYTLHAQTPVALLRIVPEYSFTTGKLPLANQQNYVTFLMNVKDPSFNQSIYLDMDYQVAEMEYDIVQRQGDMDYQESSWLSFIIPLDAAPDAALPNDSRIGQTTIPVPLRAYPTPAVIANQNAGKSVSSLRFGASPQVFEWEYHFDMKRQIAAQDSSTLEIAFNVPDGGALNRRLKGDNREALYRALAQFAFIQTEVMQDLSLLLEATPDGDAVKRFTVALNTFVQMAQQVTEAWTRDMELPLMRAASGDIYTFTLDTVVSDTAAGDFSYFLLKYVSGAADYLFSIPSSCGASLDAGDISSQVAELFSAQAYAFGQGAYVTVLAKGSAWRITDNASNRTFELIAKEKEIQVQRSYLWPQLQSKGVMLPAQQVGSQMLYAYHSPIADPVDISFTFPRLNVIAKQNGWGGVSVVRNANLVAGQETNPQFIYRTALASFPNKVTPSIQSDAEVPLAEFSVEPPSHLSQALGGFFETLFATPRQAQPDSTRTIKIGSSYGFHLFSDMQYVAGQEWLSAEEAIVPIVPLKLVTEYAFKVATDGDAGNSQSFTSTFTAATSAAQQQSGAPEHSGRYYFQLSVFSTLSDGIGQPLIQLSRLYYDLE